MGTGISICIEYISMMMCFGLWIGFAVANHAGVIVEYSTYL